MEGNSYFRVRGIHAAALLACCAVLLPASSTANIFLRMQTDLGGVDIELFDTTPATRDNLLLYVNSDSYNDTFIHRRASLDTSGVDVLQMGGVLFDPARGAFTDNSGIFHIPTFGTVVNEPGISNTRGTIAMARLGGQPDSATSEFFFNLVDNLALDTLDGGFAVFGQVTRGMDVIDEISALPRCRDIGFVLPAPCRNFPDVPLIDVQTVNDAGALFTAPIEEPNLVNLLNIGVDNDGDGIIDKIEDAASTSGDRNNDNFQDSTQTSVASFTGTAGSNVTLVTNAGVSLFDTVVLGNTFFLATQDPNNVIGQISFPDGIFGATLTAVAAGGSVTVDVMLESTSIPNAYFLYGATPTDNQPHWYEFDYDGETGAELSGNNVILHFVDGKRGDNDLQVDGIIEKSPGAPARRPGDGDGIPDAVEDAGPNNGDGNNDKILDSTQDHVTSLRDVRGNYVTVEAISPAHALSSVVFSVGLGSNPPAFPSWLNGLNFTHGFLSYALDGVTPGGPAEVRLILPAGETPVTFVKYGPEPGDATDHFHEFLYDPASGTGAEINGNIVTLHFVDGGRGDSDLTANGVLIDPGAPALAAPVSSASDGGGCSLQAASGSPWQAGAWWLLGLCLLPVAIRRMRQQLC